MPHTHVLVTDFDGTITRCDFYQLAVERLLQPSDLQPWDDYRAGRITHFEAMRRIFSRIRGPESIILDILRDTRPDPALKQSVDALKEAGWHIVVASAGCEWYVRRVLDEAGVALEIHANPGSYPEGGPLLLEEPVNSPFHSPELGVDKAGIVRFYLDKGAVVAYAGDGYTDAPAALLVQPERRFARGDLAVDLAGRGEAFIPFDVWSEAVRHLLGTVP
ncbi:MAG: HAD-IB family phosphatase [Desulfovibrio sp.]|jgi:2,3-diketo-5-methylthio-1-phosphopentane phosphatase|nr:HAD-IB family phosphatase [Desulfovibrio sp.]